MHSVFDDILSAINECELGLLLFQLDANLDEPSELNTKSYILKFICVT